MKWKKLSFTEKKSLYINPNNKEDIKIVTLHSVKFNNMKNLIFEENNANEKIEVGN
jgi:hypothetical protein